MAVPKGTRIGGRAKGTPNKATAEIKSLAQKHGPAAIAECLRIMKKSDSDQARIAAAKEIMDRAYGKPAQAIVGDENEAPVKTVMEIVWGGTSTSSAGE
jgi:hypothetical protein